MTKNYSDDEDYYNQGFAKKGVVSIWIGLQGTDGNDGIDILQDLCGVGYYRIDDQESNHFNNDLVAIEELLEDLSYAKSFSSEVLVAAHDKGLFNAKWIVAQYDFEYNPEKIKRTIAEDPLFLGIFKYMMA